MPRCQAARRGCGAGCVPPRQEPERASGLALGAPDGLERVRETRNYWREVAGHFLRLRYALDLAK